MRTITRIYRTGKPRMSTVELDCGHKSEHATANIKTWQWFIGKGGMTCPQCAPTLDLDTVVAAMKREILADIAAGTVPSTVASYSELHDHVDANLYGLPEGYVWSNADTDLLNQAQGRINRWLLSRQEPT